MLFAENYQKLVRDCRNYRAQKLTRFLKQCRAYKARALTTVKCY